MKDASYKMNEKLFEEVEAEKKKIRDEIHRTCNNQGVFRSTMRIQRSAPKSRTRKESRSLVSCN